MTEWTSSTVYVIDTNAEVPRRLDDLFSSVTIRALYFQRLDDCLEILGKGSRGCLLVDVNIEGCKPDQLFRNLAERKIRLPVIYLAQRPEVATAVDALKSGAFDFLEKPFHGQALLDSVQAALAMDQEEARQREQRRELWQRFDKLTPREREVLPLLVRGLPNRHIAEQLGLSTKTVEVHRNRIIRKTGARNLPELIRMAIRIDLLARLDAQ